MLNRPFGAMTRNYLIIVTVLGVLLADRPADAKVSPMSENETTVTMGSDSNFTCTTDTNYEIIWIYKASVSAEPIGLAIGNKVPPGTELKYSVITGLGYSEFRINGTEMKDSGTYTCQENSGEQTPSNFNYQLYVKIPVGLLLMLWYVITLMILSMVFKLGLFDRLLDYFWICC